jgi:5-methylcytosine-specific restriction enzyme A
MQRHLLAVKEFFQGKGFHVRDDRWAGVEKRHLKDEPVCQYCGGSEKLQVHHMQPFHLFPARELDPTNLITLCEEPELDCHLMHGHLGDFKLYNPNIRAECDGRKGGGLWQKFFRS